MHDMSVHVYSAMWTYACGIHMDMDVHLYEAYMNCAWKCMWRYGFVNCVGDYQCV